jgi:DNA-binding CsgD family transcriptional regulator/tetratricopeptide (TPR) repeat protein
VLELAETAGVVGVGEGGWGFRHPLLRSAALQALGPAQLRRVHQSLAAVAIDPERRAAHLAASRHGPSVEVGDALASAATSVRRRAGLGAAADIWIQAARATPVGDVRFRRLVTAGQALLTAGRIPEAVHALDEVAASANDPLVRADAVLVRCQAQVWGPNARQATEIARREAQQFARFDPERAAAILTQAAMALGLQGEIALMLTLCDQAHELARGSGLSTAVSLYLAMALTLAGRRRDAATLITKDKIELHLRNVQRVHLDDLLQTSLAFAAQPLLWSERFEEAAGLATTLSSIYRRESSPHGLPFQLAVLTEARWWTGRWTEAASYGREAVTLAEQTANPVQASFCSAITARVLAGQGDEAGCRQLVDRAIVGSELLGSPSIRLYAIQALGLLELSYGRYDQSARALLAADRIRRDVGLGDPAVVPYGGDLVEALVRADNSVVAREYLTYHLERADELASPWTLTTGLRGQALLASPDDQADQLFASALAAYPIDSFEGARTQLCWAEHLRRSRQPLRSRSLLQAAIATFEQLGARPWTKLARAELRAAGGQSPLPHPSSLAALSGQELQIALTIAEGLTNRQTASALFLSPKTVEHHLTRIYTKLQITSRSQLARVVTENQIDRPNT